MKHDDRMTMEKCLVQNFLVAKGMDYFGKKDLIYIDMLSDKDVKAISGKEIME